MARRFALNPDFMQSVPRAARQGKTTANKADTGHSSAPVRPRTTARQHWARVIGGAALASVLAFALAVSPGENPELASAKKALAKIQTMPDTLNYAPSKARNEPGKRGNERTNKRPVKQA
jgi:hypothetical protein